MKKLMLLVLCLTSCADIDQALEQRRARERDAGGIIGGGGGSIGGGGGAIGGGAGGGGGNPNVTQAGGVCFNGNCWENPTPQGNRLNAVWSNNDGGDVWIVGETGMALRWTAAGWEPLQENFPRTETLYSIWGAGNHLWVVGSRDPDLGGPTFMKPRHFNGSVWNEETWLGADSELLTVRGRNENDVWASGLSGVIGRRGPAGNWTGWVFPPALAASYVSLPALAFNANGDCRVALGSDLRGIARCEEDAGGSIELALDASYEIAVNGLWSPYGNVFRVGMARTPVSNGPSSGELWSTAGDGGWALDFTNPSGESCNAGTPNFAYCGSGVTALGEPPMAMPTGITGDAIYGAWTNGTSNLEGSWLVGDNGVMYRRNSSGWQPMRDGSIESIFSLWVDSQQALGVGASGTLFRRQANTIWGVNQLAITGDTRDVWLSGDGTFTVYVGVNRALLEAGFGFVGGVQAPAVPVETGNLFQLNGLWGTSQNDLWAVGTHAEIWHRTDAGWTATWPTNDAGPVLWDIDGTNPGLAYIVGTDCTTLLKVGSVDGGWFPEGPGGSCTDDLFGVWAAPESPLLNDAGIALVAVGSEGHTWFRGQQGGWTMKPANTPGDLFKVWGTSSGDIWAVGEYGALVHYDGMTWSPVETGTRSHLQSIRGRKLDGGATELFIAGNNGTVLRRVVP